MHMTTPTRIARPHFWPNLKKRPVYGVLLIILLSVATVFMVAQTIIAIQEALDFGKPDAQQITVEGEGTAIIAPDTATISLGVESKGDSVELAQDDNTKTTNTLIERIKALEIPAEDIRTANYNAYEDERWNPENNDYESQGWIVSQRLTVTVRDLDKVPAILQVAGQSGVTNIYGPNYETKNVVDIRAEARQQAIEQALSQAEDIATALEVKVDGVIDYSEWSSDGDFYAYAELAEADMGRGGAPAPNIEPGTEEFTMHVSITYQLSN